MAKCCVPKCNSSSSTANVSLFQFPVDEKLKNLWIEAIENGTGSKIDLENSNPTSRNVCQHHFKDKDYITGVRPNRKIYREITGYAIPSVFTKVSDLKIDEAKSKCRTCLVEQGEILVKDNLLESSVSIERAVAEIFDFKFSEQKHFPQKICKDCHDIIYTAYTFKTKILRTDSSLKVFDNVIAKTRAKSSIYNRQTTTTTTQEDAVFVINEVDESDLNLIPEMATINHELTTESISTESGKKVTEIKSEKEAIIVDINEELHEFREFVYVENDGESMTFEGEDTSNDFDNGMLQNQSPSQSIQSNSSSKSSRPKRCYVENEQSDMEDGQGSPKVPKNQEKIFECPKCHKTYTKANSLRQHLRTHRALTNHEFVCGTCAQVFSRKENLIKHCKRKNH